MISFSTSSAVFVEMNSDLIQSPTTMTMIPAAMAKIHFKGALCIGRKSGREEPTAAPPMIIIH